MARKLRSMDLPGPAGRLEALLEEVQDDRAVGRAAVICHPHPQYGGTMHNKVVYRMAKAARGEGAAVLRFNYRGVGRSSGTYDGGVGERADLRAAIRYMREKFPDAALTVGGFSFGSRLALQVCCDDQGIERVVAVGTPVKRGDWSFLRHCGCQKRFIHSTRDEYGPQSDMLRVFNQAGRPKSLAWIEAQDHFFAAALDELEAAVRTALDMG